jgi:hypothetical protein
MVEQQKGIEFGDLIVRKYAVKQHALAVGNQRGLSHPFNASVT